MVKEKNLDFAFYSKIFVTEKNVISTSPVK